MSAPRLFADGEWEEAWCITTRSGSIYLIARDRAGAWWMQARNIPNPGSCALPLQLWQIDAPEPWPARLGAELNLFALSSLEYDDPARAPGGGKVTSDVSTIEQLVPATTGAP
jgi:hypothetical protein